MPKNSAQTYLKQVPSDTKWNNNMYWTLPVDEAAENIAKFSLPIPYKTPELYPDGSVVGFENITQGVNEGRHDLYNKNISDSLRFYRDANGDYYSFKKYIDNAINLKDFKEIPYSEIRKALPKRDYLGGENYRVRAAQMIPGFTEKIHERAAAYGVDPNLILHRFLKEGYIDQLVQEYNGLGASEQKTFWNGLWDRGAAGYGQLGLDYAGDELLSGKYELLDPNASWSETEWEDDEGSGSHRHGRSIAVDDLSSAIEIMSAALKYRQGLVKDKYGVSDSDLGTWANAAFNMGLNHSKLNDPVYVRKQYVYPDYYTKFGLKYSEGGPVLVGKQKLQALAKRISDFGYYSEGGKIHIKPENRGKFTALKERTGHSSTWFKEHGTPAQKKMATFALNARKWKHGDGGFLDIYYPDKSI